MRTCEVPGKARGLSRARAACAAVAFGLMGRALIAQQQPQTALTRAAAVAAGLERAPTLGVARADTVAAFAQVITSRAFQNPVLSASYSKDVPQYHVTMELPIDFPALRRARIGSAEAARRAAAYRFAFERAAVILDVDTSYTRALAAREHARLSRRNAEEADSLRVIAVKRRDAGDASDMDVELATVNAGQAGNAAAADSLAFASAVLDLQAAMGLADRGVAIAPTDSLTAPPPDTSRSASADEPLSVAAAQASFEAATLGLRAQRRSVFTAPSVMFGVETGDPKHEETGLLPTFGIALPLPFLNTNHGPIEQARAEALRAQAELALATVQSRTAIERSRRALMVATARIQRDQTLVTSANRVASLALTAYREGAAPLATVLEAQRNAREVLAQYVDDLAAAWIAGAELRALTLTSADSVQ